MKKQNLIIIIMLINLLVINIVSYSIYSFLEHKNQQDKPNFRLIGVNYNPIYTSYKDCEDKDLLETTDCLVQYTKTFYNHVPNSLDVPKTADYIMDNGGDCYDYSRLYAEFGNNLGFSTDVLLWKVNEMSLHQIAMIYDETGYCFIDQISGMCMFYDKLEGK